MEMLRNEIRDYAWGSKTSIPRFLGVPATDRPAAELWLSARPGSSSYVVAEGHLASSDTAVSDLVATMPETVLGQCVLDKFGPRIPYLMKVIAPAMPLSIQVHPDADAARRGYDAGTYGDPFHKPEMLLALEQFDVLCGFRPAAETGRIFAALDCEELDPYIALLTSNPLEEQGLRQVVTELCALEPPTASRIVATVAVRASEMEAAGSTDEAPEIASALRTAVEANTHFPGDIGVVIAMMLNREHLLPGEAIFVGAGVVHCYLSGLGIEIMAASDNVLRAGLTGKEVDVAELLSVTDFTPTAVPKLEPVTRDGVAVFAPPVAEFELVTIVAEPERPVRLAARGPKIALVTSGAVTLTTDAGTRTLTQAESVLVPDSDGSVTVSGKGSLVLGTVPGHNV